jgi:O-antigen/teichoic acid export membrane protein
VARGFLALGLGEALSRLIAFGAMVYAARTLGASLYGTIGVAVAVVLYSNRVVDAGFELGLGLREIAADPSFVRRVAPAVQTFRTALAIVVAGIVSILALALLPAPDGAVIAVQSLTLIAVGIGTRWIHLGLGRTGLAALAATVGQLAMAAGIILLVRGPGDVLTVPASQVVGDLIGAAILLVALHRGGHPIGFGFDWAALKPLLPRAWHLVASALLGIAIYSSGLLALRALRGASDAGYYTAAYTLVTFFLNVGAMYNLSLLPSLTRLSSEPGRQRTLFADAMVQVLAVSLPLAAGGTLLAAPLVGLVYGPSYAPAVIPFALLLWSIPLNLARDVSLMGLMAAGEERLVFRVTVVGAVVSIGLALAMVPPFGLMGAGVATLCAEAVRTVIAYRLARPRGYRLPGGWRTLRLGGATAAMAVAIWVLAPGRLGLGIGLGVVVYALALVATRGIVFGGPRRVEVRL